MIQAMRDLATTQMHIRVREWRDLIFRVVTLLRISHYGELANHLTAEINVLANDTRLQLTDRTIQASRECRDRSP